MGVVEETFLRVFRRNVNVCDKNLPPLAVCMGAGIWWLHLRPHRLELKTVVRRKSYRRERSTRNLCGYVCVSVKAMWRRIIAKLNGCHCLVVKFREWTTGNGFYRQFRRGSWWLFGGCSVWFFLSLLLLLRYRFLAGVYGVLRFMAGTGEDTAFGVDNIYTVAMLWLFVAIYLHARQGRAII